MAAGRQHLGGAEDESLAARRIVGTNVIGQSDPERLPTVLRMADEGALAVPITRSGYAFDELPEALGLAGERRSRGKFAVTISS